MKRTKRKLELQRTTLVELTPKQLVHVAGGGDHGIKIGPVFESGLIATKCCL